MATEPSAIQPLRKPTIEGLLKELLKLIGTVVGYYTGIIVLHAITWGRVRPAPLGTIGSTNPDKTRWTDGSQWLKTDPARKMLKAEYVSLVGVAAWAALIALVYFLFLG